MNNKTAPSRDPDIDIALGTLLEAVDFLGETLRFLDDRTHRLRRTATLRSDIPEDTPEEKEVRAPIANSILEATTRVRALTLDIRGIGEDLEI